MVNNNSLKKIIVSAVGIAVLSAGASWVVRGYLDEKNHSSSLSSVRQEVVKLTENNESLQNYNHELEGMISNLEKEILKLGVCQNNLEFSKNSYAYLQKENDKLKSDLSDLNIKLDFSKSNNVEYLKRLENILADYQKVRTDFSSIKESYTTLQVNHQKMEQDFLDKDAQVGLLKQSNEECNQNLDDFRFFYTTCQDDLAKSETFVESQKTEYDTQVKLLETQLIDCQNQGEYNKILLNQCSNNLNEIVEAPRIVGIGSNVWDVTKQAVQDCSMRVLDDKLKPLNYSSEDGKLLYGLVIEGLCNSGSYFYSIQSEETQESLNKNCNLIKPGMKLNIPCDYEQ